MWSPINRMRIVHAITRPQSSSSRPKNSARTESERATGLSRSDIVSLRKYEVAAKRTRTEVHQQHRPTACCLGARERHWQLPKWSGIQHRRCRDPARNSENLKETD